MSEIVLEAKGLAKRYGSAVAVDGIDLSIRAGEVIGLLGPNGAGKTTTILMLLGLTESSAGSVSILGKDPLRQPLAVKRDVGYLPDAVGFYETMRAARTLPTRPVCPAWVQIRPGRGLQRRLKKCG